MTESAKDRTGISRRIFIEKQGKIAVAVALGLAGTGAVLTGNTQIANAQSVTGSGTVGKVAKWVGASSPTTTIGDSIQSDTGTSISPVTDSAYDLGTSGNRWNNLYIASAIRGNTTLIVQQAITGQDQVLRVVAPESSPSTRSRFEAIVSGEPNPRARLDLLGLWTGPGGGVGCDTQFIRDVAGRWLSNTIRPVTDNSQDLGTTTQRWSNLYAAGVLSAAGINTATRRNVFGSLGTNFQNTTGKNLLVSAVVATPSTVPSTFVISLQTDSSPIPQPGYGAGNTFLAWVIVPTNGNTVTHTVTGMVPANWYYVVAAQNGGELLFWNETTF